MVFRRGEKGDNRRKEQKVARHEKTKPPRIGFQPEDEKHGEQIPQEVA